MKELSIEEKAKRYESALERCRKLYNEAKANEYTSDIEDYETIFPELKESEDERIRKAIHIYLDWLDGRNKDYQPKGDYSIKDMIAWLEKQGEKKPQRMISAEAKEAMYDKPAWSEEDKEKLGNAIYACLHIYGKDSDTADWLKSLRKRIEGE